VVSLSVANFWVGLLLIIVFAVQLGRGPAAGGGGGGGCGGLTVRRGPDGAGGSPVRHGDAVSLVQQ
ncbi:hypothetical protein ACFVX7_29465, partial [Streptomyces sp. NPDC058280]